MGLFISLLWVTFRPLTQTVMLFLKWLKIIYTKVGNFYSFQSSFSIKCKKEWMVYSHKVQKAQNNPKNYFKI